MTTQIFCHAHVTTPTYRKYKPWRIETKTSQQRAEIDNEQRLTTIDKYWYYKSKYKEVGVLQSADTDSKV